MTRDPFLRLALIACASVYVVGLVLVAHWLGLFAAFVVYAGGTVLAVCLSVTLDEAPSLPDLRRRHRQPAEGTRGFERVG